MHLFQTWRLEILGVTSNGSYDGGESANQARAVPASRIGIGESGNPFGSRLTIT